MLLTLVFLMTALQVWAQRRGPHPEVVRKLLHIGMGLVACSFPWLFAGPAPVLGLAAASVVAMGAVRQVPGLRKRVGGVLHGVGRQSYGELCFPLGVALVFVLAKGDALRFVLPVLLLTLADPAAALVGQRLGRLRFRTPDGWKSGEGSAAFFSVAFGLTYGGLRLAGTAGTEGLLLALLLAVLLTLIEALAWRGLDNLFIPLAGYVLLAAHQPMGAGPLAGLLVLWSSVLGLGLLAYVHRFSPETVARFYRTALLAGSGPATLAACRIFGWIR